MDAVQRMRKKAKEKGALETNEQQKVETQVVETKEVIIIESASPEVIYVPSYSPVVVYGPPVYPYPPIYYPPYPPGAAFVSFSFGVMWGAAWGGSCCHCGWGGNDIDINIDNNFNRNTNINRAATTTGSTTRSTAAARPTRQGHGQQVRRHGAWRLALLPAGERPGSSRRAAAPAPPTARAPARVHPTRGRRRRPQCQQPVGYRQRPCPSASTSNRSSAGSSRAPSASTSSRGGGLRRLGRLQRQQRPSEQLAWGLELRRRSGGGRGGGRR